MLHGPLTSAACTLNISTNTFMAVIAYQPHVFAFRPRLRLASLATKAFLVTVEVFTLDRLQRTFDIFHFVIWFLPTTRGAKVPIIQTCCWLYSGKRVQWETLGEQSPITIRLLGQSSEG